MTANGFHKYDDDDDDGLSKEEITKEVGENVRFRSEFACDRFGCLCRTT